MPPNSPPPEPAVPLQDQPLPQKEVQLPVLPSEAQTLPQETSPPPAPPPLQAAEPEANPSLLPSREPEVAAAPERRALPSSEQLTRLRGDFDRFLAQPEWGSKRLSESERSRLFNEYLRWNYGTLAATPDAPR